MRFIQFTKRSHVPSREYISFIHCLLKQIILRLQGLIIRGSRAGRFSRRTIISAPCREENLGKIRGNSRGKLRRHARRDRACIRRTYAIHRFLFSLLFGCEFHFVLTRFFVFYNGKFCLVFNFGCLSRAVVFFNSLK